MSILQTKEIRFIENHHGRPAYFAVRRKSDTPGTAPLGPGQVCTVRDLLSKSYSVGNPIYELEIIIPS